MKQAISPKEIINAGLCIGCGSCVAQHPGTDASMQWDQFGQLKPKGKAPWLTQPSEGFSRTCPFSPAASNENELAAALYPDTPNHEGHIGKYTQCYVGHVAEAEFRLRGSSGGMVSWVATELMRQGLIDGVAHVVPVTDPAEQGNFFKFRISRTEEEIQEGAKSRYYPIELSEVLQTIRNTPGRYAIVGIPCFIKAIQLLRSQDPVFRERIPFTLGLFCGHMKSARFIESFAWQLGVPLAEVKQVEFRRKDPTRPANWYNATLTLYNGTQVNRDWWHLADGDWGAGFFMNHACNFCDDVVGETADISFGDAWVEPYSSDGRGTNVVVVRSQMVQQLVSAAIDEGRLQLTKVDADFVVQTQAAGFRQRREGMAYRLSWGNKGLQPVKRLPPDDITPSKNRKMVYRMRYWISEGSHRFAYWAHRTGKSRIYTRWAYMAAALYHGLAYQRGKVGALVKKLKLYDQ